MKKHSKNEIAQPEGNYFDKYSSSNIIVRWLMKGFFGVLDEMLDFSGITSGGHILEAGCGEGNIINHVSNYLSQTGMIKYSAFDISEKLIKENSSKYPKIDFFINDIYEPINESAITLKDEPDLIICSEVLEHLKKPEQAIMNLLHYGNNFIISVPREPIWRILNFMRGKYIRNLGNTPGHIQHFSVKSLCDMMERCGLKITRIKKPMPWIVIYCVK